MEPSSSSSEESPEGPTDIEVFYNKLTDKKADLKETKSVLELENKICEKKYNDLKKILTLVNQAIQENVRLYQTLFDDTKIALEVCTLQAVGTPGKTVTPKKPNVRAASAPRSIISHKKIHIEPLNLKNCANLNVVQNERIVLESERSFDNAPVVEESPEKLKSRELIVNIDRLPACVVHRHSLAANTSSFSSTPEPYVTFMQKLGLLQLSREDSSELDKERPRFVDRRKSKRDSSNSAVSIFKSQSRTPNCFLLSALANSNGTKKSPNGDGTRRSREVSGNTPGPSASDTGTGFVTKRKKLIVESPEEKSALSRPQRKAKPKVLKEESLKKKKRRSE